MVSTEKFSHLVELVYDAALSPARWPQALAEIQTSLSGCGCLFGIAADNKPEAIHHCGYDTQAIAQLIQHYTDVSYVWSCVASAPEGTMIHDRQIMAPERRAKDIFANEWAPRHDTSDCVILPLWKRDRLTAFTVFARSPGVGHFDQRNLDIVRRLQPHIRHAAVVQARLDQSERQVNISLSALEEMTLGVILVSAEGSIVFTNAVAERYLAGGRLRCEANELAGRTPHETRALRALIAKAATSWENDASGGGIAMLDQDVLTPPLIVRSVPLSNVVSRQLLGGQAVVMLLLNEVGGATSPSSDLLKLAFGLTRTEATVARLIAEGRSVHQIVEQLGTARSTVVTHLSAIFAKTQTQRQADLVRALRSVPQLASDDADDHSNRRHHREV